MRGFILTIDALLALGLALTAVAVTIAAVPHESYNPAGLAMIGHDYLQLQKLGLLSEDQFTKLTGLHFASDKNVQSPFKVHAVLYNYTTSCRNLVPVSCFASSDFATSNSFSEGWVTP